jgi:aerobic-type carbon monoxide dehydrogenase small subunit (CoxS/CutS family)
MVIATIALLRATPNPTEQDIARMLDRNVCRCGSYPRIVQAIKLAAERMASTPSAGGRR